jgi:hypothetical protein
MISIEKESELMLKAATANIDKKIFFSFYNLYTINSQGLQQFM